MGQPKNGGYSKLDALDPSQIGSVLQSLQMGMGNQQQAAQGYASFLPGGGGGKPIIDAANKNFQQQTMPSILSALGSGSKSSSDLNQALAAGASDLNSNLGSMLAQMQLSAAGGLAGLGSNQQQAGLTNTFAYQPTQMPFWQQLLLASISGGSQAGKSAISGGFGG